MKIHLVLVALLTTSISFSEMRPIDKVYIVEGVVADRETLKCIPSAFLYNDSLGVMTTSDEKGYFKLVVPGEIIEKRKIIYLDIVKTGYKRNGSGFSFNPSKADTIHTAAFAKVMWNYDVKIFWMAKNESLLSSTNGAYARTNEGVYNTNTILQTFNKAVTSELRGRKMEQLKRGNEKVFFLINGKAAMATASSDVYFDNGDPIVFINNKRVKLTEINNQLKRSQANVDWSKSDAFSKQYRKDVITFVVNN
ncbi:MAG: hypothetical protein ABL872_10465 [Lacibacter sp.]